MSEDIYDAYIAADGVSALLIPLNQYENFTADISSNIFSPIEKQVSHCKVPYTALQTESDASSWGAFLNKLQDSDNPGFPCRLYEFAGGSHDTTICYVDYYNNDKEVQRVGKSISTAPKYIGSHSQGNNYPYELLFSAAFRNMFY